MSDTRYHKMAQVRALRIRRKHFDFASDSTYCPSSALNPDTETRILRRSYGHHLAWVSCTEKIIMAEDGR